MSPTAVVAPETETEALKERAEDGCYLSIIIPAYNEKYRLPATLEKVLTYLRKHEWTWEVLVADDGSSDGSPQAISKQFPDVRVLMTEQNLGKGAAVRRGMMAAAGKLRLFTDADLSTPIEELDGMVLAMEAGKFDVVIASRALPDSELVIRQPWWRELAGRLFNGLVQPISGLPFVDTQCGFKLFRAEAARLLFPRQKTNGWAFDVEILMMAQMFGLAMLEHPVRWENSDASKVSLWRAAPKMLRDVIRFRWWRITGRLGQLPE